jgi:hypothetical protein
MRHSRLKRMTRQWSSGRRLSNSIQPVAGSMTRGGVPGNRSLMKKGKKEEKVGEW